MSDGRVVSRTIAELVFKEEDFATCSAQQDMGVEGFTRRNMDNMVEKDSNIGSSKSKAGYGKTLQRTNSAVSGEEPSD